MRPDGTIRSFLVVLDDATHPNCKVLHRMGWALPLILSCAGRLLTQPTQLTHWSDSTRPHGVRQDGLMSDGHPSNV